jgi:hypothetical protein
MYYLVYLAYERDGGGLVTQEDLKRYSRIFSDEWRAEEYRAELDATEGAGWMRARVLACGENGCEEPSLEEP